MQHGQHDAVEFLEPFLNSNCDVVNVRQLFGYTISTSMTCMNCGMVSNRIVFCVNTSFNRYRMLLSSKNKCIALLCNLDLSH